jgi:hypothetical protein
LKSRVIALFNAQSLRVERMTERVNSLRGDAIAVIARRTMRLTIDPMLSAQLAQAGSIDVALRALEERLPVRRSAAGLPQSADVQQRLAIIEVAGRLSAQLDTTTKRQFGRSLIDAEVRSHDAATRSAAQIASVQDMIDALEAAEPGMRGFLRAASRIYSERVSVLRAKVSGTAYENAIVALDKLFADTIQLSSGRGAAP